MRFRARKVFGSFEKRTPEPEITSSGPGGKSKHELGKTGLNNGDELNDEKHERAAGGKVEQFYRLIRDVVSRPVIKMSDNKNHDK